MNCKSCNSPLSNEAVFCPNCGALIEEDLEATGLLIEEEEETGLLGEDGNPNQNVYTPSQPIYEPQPINTDNVNPAYVNPTFNQQSAQPQYQQPPMQTNQPNSYVQPVSTNQDNTYSQNYNTAQTVVEQPTLGNCYKKFWNNYANFNGRARRSEYWFVVLLNLIIGLVNIIPYVGEGLYGLYSLAIIVPTLALIVRRLHDLGKEWYNIFFFLIPIAGSIIILVWMCTDSQIGANKFGENPKGIN